MILKNVRGYKHIDLHESYIYFSVFMVKESHAYARCTN
jgi:hypothetical protein